MKLAHFETLAPVCPLCRRQGLDHALSIAVIERESRDDIAAGILQCTACGAEYPVIDGLPILVPDVRQFVQKNLFYLLARDNGGVPDQAMLDAVSARLTRPDVRPRNVWPRVHSAIIDEIDVIADIWLLPDAAESRLAELAANAKATHNAEQALDRDLTHHYLRRLLDTADVYKIAIAAPTADLIADPSRAYAIRSITPRLAGRMR